MKKTYHSPEEHNHSHSDPTHPVPERKVGYGNPPIERQFKKGTSGNPRGRPPKKERALTRRQLRRDILRLGETPTVLRTEKGRTTVTAYEAVLMRAMNKALAGHGPSIRLIVKLYSEAIAEHNDAHNEKFSILELDEKVLTLHADYDKDDPEVVAFRKRFLQAVNWKRKSTRRT